MQDAFDGDLVLLCLAVKVFLVFVSFFPLSSYSKSRLVLMDFSLGQMPSLYIPLDEKVTF
jgi:hypothetical protein